MSTADATQGRQQVGPICEGRACSSFRQLDPAVLWMVNIEIKWFYLEAAFRKKAVYLVFREKVEP
jgi:hypothetical protein